jgi:hypothetical protein
LVGEPLLPYVEEIVGLVGDSRHYGRLLSRAFAFPGAVSDQLDLPMLVILDEFQEIRRLLNFPGTENLWAVIREALDRRGKVAFAIAGSIVTAMREILHRGNEPLFTRFHELELPPFDSGDTQELATGLWERAGFSWSQNASQRLHALTQGFPFYVHTLALSTLDEARPSGTSVDGDHVDATFQTQILDRNSTISIYCQYLFERAVGDVRGESIPDGVLRYLASHEGKTRADVARALRRGNLSAQISRVVRELIEVDILADREGGLWFVDPVLPIWVALEHERRAPTTLLPNPEARARVTRRYEERIQALQESVGLMFEKRVHNVLRQFRGQTVSGRLFGTAGQVVLPSVEDVRNVVLSDPKGEVSGSPGSVELDGVTRGSERWCVECKHRAGGVTSAAVDRFDRASRFFETVSGERLGRRWYVSQTGFRIDARARCEELGIYFSTLRDLNQLERVLAR